MRYIGFDTEVDGLAQTDADLHITCAAICTPGKELVFPRGANERTLSDEESNELAKTLWRCHEDEGSCLATFNGTGFDWPILMRQAPLWAEQIRTMALESVDLMMIVLAQKGFPVSLDAMSRAMLGQGKIKGFSGEHAPPMWCGSGDMLIEAELEARYGVTPGSPEARDLTRRYVASDAMLTSKLATMIEQTKQITWITKRGNYSSFPLFIGSDLRSLRVSQLSKLPRPNTSWMNRPPMLTLDSATDWLR